MVKIKINIKKNGRSEEREMLLFDIEAKAEELMNFNREDLRKGDRRPLERT